MKSERRKQGYYIIPWALAAAFLIRAMLLRDRPETYIGEHQPVLGSPLFFYVLSSICFIVGLYLLIEKKK